MDGPSRRPTDSSRSEGTPSLGEVPSCGARALWLLWGFSKVTRCKSGTDISHHPNNGYTPSDPAPTTVQTVWVNTPPPQGLLGIQRRQAGGIRRRVLLSLGNRDGLDRTPKVFTQPEMATFAVERTIQPVQRIRQRHKPRRHAGQRLRLLPCPGIQRLARGLRVVGLGCALEVVEQ